VSDPRQREGITGYNLLDCLSDRCAAAGVLAGFSITVSTIATTIAASSEVLVSPFSFRDLASTLICIAAVLFLVALEYFLSAKENNAWDLNPNYVTDVRETVKDFDKKLIEMHLIMKAAEMHGRRAYNLAVYTLFGGMFFASSPFSPIAAVIISVVGVESQVYQAWPFRGPADDSGRAADQL